VEIEAHDRPEQREWGEKDVGRVGKVTEFTGGEPGPPLFRHEQRQHADGSTQEAKHHFVPLSHEDSLRPVVVRPTEGEIRLQPSVFQRSDMNHMQMSGHAGKTGKLPAESRPAGLKV
jgi:hypothetical protein